MMEGVACIIAGAFGIGIGVTSYSECVGNIALTRVSRIRVNNSSRATVLVFSICICLCFCFCFCFLLFVCLVVVLFLFLFCFVLFCFVFSHNVKSAFNSHIYIFYTDPNNGNGNV